MNVVLIYNPKSGSNYGLTQIRKLFKTYGLAIDYSFTVKQLGSKKLAQLIQQGATVAVIGGDGTLNASARLLIDTPGVFMPLPGGTFNHFVRDLGMSPQVEDVLSRIDTGKVHTIDVGVVNNELFLNNSNLGLYPFSLIERKTTKKIFGKYMAAIMSSFDQLSLFRRHKLVIDGQTIKSPFVFVGNNVYDIKQSLIPQRSDLTKGVLTVMVATSKSRLSLMRAAFAVIRGDISHRDDFSFSTRKNLTIYSHQKRIPVSFDGEVKHLAPPLEYSSRAKCLKVLVVKAQ